MLARDNGWSAVRFNDYEILHRMFLDDTGGKKFRPAANGGFEVTDPAVLHEALKELAGRVQEFTFSLEKERLIIIEFARSDYRTALKLFRHELLHDAYLLLLYADINMCIQRKSVVYSANQDDHFVSEETIRTYYSYDDLPYIRAHLKANYGVTDERVKIIKNTGPSMSFFKEVTHFAQSLLKKETGISRETDQVPSISVPASSNEANQIAHVSQETEPIHIVASVDDSVEP